LCSGGLSGGDRCGAKRVSEGGQNGFEVISTFASFVNVTRWATGSTRATSVDDTTDFVDEGVVAHVTVIGKCAQFFDVVKVP
jgi:antibiotic biosynthesis monooxygenase (ABM) superfamily enzyme